MTCVSQQLASPKAGMEPGVMQTTHNRKNFINYMTGRRTRTYVSQTVMFASTCVYKDALAFPAWAYAPME